LKDNTSIERDDLYVHKSETIRNHTPQPARLDGRGPDAAGGHACVGRP
jgi:hypothetical protein